MFIKRLQIEICLCSTFQFTSVLLNLFCKFHILKIKHFIISPNVYNSIISLTLRYHLKSVWHYDRVTVKYHGKASHAAGFPWEGVNALDAAVMAYTSVSVMRQQCKPTWRIHGDVYLYQRQLYAPSQLKIFHAAPQIAPVFFVLRIIFLICGRVANS